MKDEYKTNNDFRYANYIKKIRNEFNLTKTSMSEILGIKLPSLLSIEAGEVKKPNEKIINKLALFLNKTSYEILNEIYPSEIQLSDVNEYLKNVMLMEGNHYIESLKNNKRLHHLADENVIICLKAMLLENDRSINNYAFFLTKLHWNIVENNLDEFPFYKKLYKKTDKRNIKYIDSWDNLQLHYDKDINYDRIADENINILSKALFDVMQYVEEKPRCIEILFFTSIIKHMNIYKFLKSLKFYAPKFFVKFVLFDPVENCIIDEFIVK